MNAVYLSQNLPSVAAAVCERCVGREDALTNPELRKLFSFPERLLFGIPSRGKNPIQNLRPLFPVYYSVNREGRFPIFCGNFSAYDQVIRTPFPIRCGRDT